VINGAGHAQARLLQGLCDRALPAAEGTSAADAINAKGAKRVAIVTLRDLTAEQFVDALIEALKNNHDEAALKALQPKIDQFRSTMLTIGNAPEKSAVNLDWLPESGTRLTFNGAQKGSDIPARTSIAPCCASGSATSRCRDLDLKEPHLLGPKLAWTRPSHPLRGPRLALHSQPAAAARRMRRESRLSLARFARRAGRRRLRVLDLSRVLAGPWASQLLGDLGADVIKVEKPGADGKGGDDTRGWGPPWLADGAGKPTTDAAYFLCTNRNKRSLTVDITRPEGQAIVRELAAQSDVVLENFKVGGLKAYGLDYASLRRSIRGSCIARSPASARTGPTPRAPATTS
jgi:hypothetical protein